MSIDARPAKAARSFRTLMFSAAMRLLPIKDLKDLSVFFEVGATIDMQVLKDLKRRFFSHIPRRPSADKTLQSPQTL